MVKLGQVFSRAFRDSVVNSRLFAGSVIRVQCDFTKPPRMKLLVVVAATPEVLVFVINSRINKFIKKRPKLLRCQVRLSADDYGFLRHDSVINCAEVVTESNVGNLRDKMIADIAATHLGRLSKSALHEVLAATRLSPKISKVRKERVVSALNAALDSD